jgi:phosphatidylinositol glycan class N
MEPVIADIQRPAKRVIVFSSDGGRADRFFEVDSEGKPRAPFLVGKAVDKGTWGVSHTRVPTESRPGHVSMLAGIYEDMSAVTKGWQHNPVEFDSVINRRHATQSRSALYSCFIVLSFSP